MNTSTSSRVEIAVYLLDSDPDLTILAAAKLAGCNRTALYRNEEVRRIVDRRANARTSAKNDIVHGYVTMGRGDGGQLVFEAIDEKQLDPLEVLIQKESLEAAKAVEFD